ncbi:MAG: redoxin domain-containing protein [Rhodocyclaceae bacterium]|nr:redoxin domain-containing protein [Rhodocyclaceae bacterium]
MRIVRGIAWLLLFVGAWAQAAQLRPFGKGDMARLLAERQGHAFVLTLWSTDCPHCKTSLRQLAALAKTHPQLDLVVVNTDSADESQTIAAMLAAVGLGGRDIWVFAAAAPERLRFEIDRHWGGELPRTYLFESDHQFAAFSGPVDAGALQQWLVRHAGADRPPHPHP